MTYLGIDQHAKQLTLSLRSQHGNIMFNRQVSTEPSRFAQFFAQLRDRTADEGYTALVEVCGFNDWLLKILPEYGVRKVHLSGDLQVENQRTTLLRKQAGRNAWFYLCHRSSTVFLEPNFVSSQSSKAF